MPLGADMVARCKVCGAFDGKPCLRNSAGYYMAWLQDCMPY